MYTNGDLDPGARATMGHETAFYDCQWRRPPADSVLGMNFFLPHDVETQVIFLFYFLFYLKVHFFLFYFIQEDVELP